jgi:hypothetical protein
MTAPDLEQIKQRDTLADKAYNEAIKDIRAQALQSIQEVINS